jgi:hypothetical protein
MKKEMAAHRRLLHELHANYFSAQAIRSCRKRG